MDLYDQDLQDNFSLPLLRFKTIVLKVIDNLSWLMDNSFLTPINLFESKAKETLIDSNEISVFHKLIMFKPPEERTQFELESLKWIFAVGFKFFNLCPIESQMALIRNASYTSYGPGRWILKEGHSPENMYLIIKGSVRLTKYVYNPISKILDLIEYCKLNENKSFGVSSVKFNTRRTTSAQSLSTLELIKISKFDFVNIIKDNLRLHWNSNLVAITSLTQFNYLSTKDLNECSTVSFIKTFKKQEHVLSDGLGDIDYGHFIIEGKISLITRLKITKSVDFSRNIELKLFDTSRQSANKRKCMEWYMNTCTFFSKTCFNIGERMDDKTFIASEKSKCLCVPHWFMKKTEKFKHWDFLKINLYNFIPNKEELLKVIVDSQYKIASIKLK